MYTIQPSTLDWKSIVPPELWDIDEDKASALADAIVQTGGCIRPLVVRRDPSSPHDTFLVEEGQEQLYAAWVLAQERWPGQQLRRSLHVQAIVIESHRTGSYTDSRGQWNQEDAVLQQLDLLD